jgi:hypothetical protein
VQYLYQKRLELNILNNNINEHNEVDKNWEIVKITYSLEQRKSWNQEKLI